MPLLGSRFGLAGIVAAVLGLAIVGLLLRLAWRDAELADERRQVAVLQAALQEQNAAVVSWQESADADAAARSGRALRAMTPRPKPPTRSIEELNRWLASP